MRRSRLAWFWLLAPLAVAALGWASFTALAKERAVNSSRHHFARRSKLEAIVQRLDTLVTVLVTRESELPLDAFASFTTDRSVRTDGTVRPVASPLVRPPDLHPKELAALSGPLVDTYRSGIPTPRLARLYFELSDAPDGSLRPRLPAAPQGPWRELAVSQGLTTTGVMERVEARAAELERRVPAATLRQLASSGILPTASADRRSFVPVLFSSVAPPLGDPDAEPVEVAELVLLRLVQAPTGLAMQGIWYDWPILHGMLHAVGSQELGVGELGVVPDSRRLVDGLALPPHRPAVSGNQGQLGSLAIKLLVSGLPPFEPKRVTPTAVSLGAALLLFVASLGAFWAFLRRSEELATRRTRFASAVTHELRTPLTTLCMYAEMLEAGLVKDPDQVAAYHATLRREGQRLAGLIDNVLAHAGLGEGGGVAVESVDLADLLDSLEPRLTERCGRLEVAAGQDALVVDRAGLPAGTRVKADPRGLERVLINLVENACKYGAAPVELRAEVTGGRAHLRVVDAGPGVERRHRRRIFEAYDRGAAEASGDRASRTEGLGLGLSLARNLCRAMGGDLELEHPGPGRPRASEGARTVTGGKERTRDASPTTFHLHLPLADPAPGA